MPYMLFIVHRGGCEYMLHIYVHTVNVYSLIILYVLFIVYRGGCECYIRVYIHICVCTCTLDIPCVLLLRVRGGER